MRWNYRTWRTLLVWLHVLSSVGWMSQAVTLATLLGVSQFEPAGAVKVATVEIAGLLDTKVLVLSANMSALTGLTLGATTTWGFFHHWWVTVKFVLTFGQLYAGIFVLSPVLPDAAAAARTGADGPAGAIVVGGVLMAGALAFQAWVSVAKPWGRTALASRGRPVAAPTWLLVAAVAASLVDGVVCAVLGPRPVASLLVLLVALVHRAQSGRPVRSRPAAA